MFTRSQRRAISRDEARAHPIPPRQHANGFYADHVNARVPMAVRPPSARSGQLRVNAKRNQRAEFWRSVKVSVSTELEPYFRKTLHLLGAEARIQGCSKSQDWFRLDFDVHLPGIPAGAVRGEPVYYSDWNGKHHVPRVDYIDFYDADGKRIEASVKQTAGAV